MNGRKPEIVAIDTNIFTYYFDSNSIFYHQAEKILKKIALQEIQIITSILTLAELLSFKATKADLDILKQEFLMIPNLVIINVDGNIAGEAARIRREYGFRLPDAIQLATAICHKAEVFITNDKKLKIFKELQIIDNLS